MFIKKLIKLRFFFCKKKMSTNFPLYDNLIKDIKSEELTTKEKDDFMKLIKILVLFFFY